jgi:hypothetical protein
MCDCVTKVRRKVAIWKKTHESLEGLPFDKPNSRAGAASKVVFDMCPIHVLKVKRRRDSYGNQTLAEIERWLGANKTLKNRLCPIIAYSKNEDYTWILARKAITPVENHRSWNVVENILDRYGVNDIHGDNMGTIGAKLVCIDYGL